MLEFGRINYGLIFGFAGSVLEKGFRPHFEVEISKGVAKTEWYYHQQQIITIDGPETQFGFRP